MTDRFSRLRSVCDLAEQYAALAHVPDLDSMTLNQLMLILIDFEQTLDIGRALYITGDRMDSEQMSEINRRMDALRGTIRTLIDERIGKEEAWRSLETNWNINRSLWARPH